MDNPVFLPKWFMAVLEEESMRGKEGAAGVSVDKVSLEGNDLFVHFSNGEKHNAGTIDTLTGECGADGKAGERGIDGSDGSRGLDGRDGLPGTNGADGRDGEQGNRGQAGGNGSDGLDGTNGEVGLQGSKGDKGEQGRAPKHQIDTKAGRIRFERPDGGWGGWVQIKQEIKHEVMGNSGGGGAKLTQAIQDIKGLLTNANAAIYGLGTGLIDITLPGIAKLTNTTGRLHAGSGYFVDLSTITAPTITYTTWDQQDFTDPYVATNLRTWIGVDSSGVVQTFADEITSAQRRNYIQVGVFSHIDGATITNINLLPVAVHDQGG